MPKPGPCAVTGCASSAEGYVPNGDTDDLYCAPHLEERAAAGLITCFLDERPCPDCQGRSQFWQGRRCETCKSAGVVADQDAGDEAGFHPCSKCKGRGTLRNRTGRPPKNFFPEGRAA